MQLKINITVFFILFGSLFMGISQTRIIDEVIAVVGDNPVLRSDIEYQYQQAMMQGHSFAGDLKCHIFEEQLLQNLLLEQAKIDSIEVNENMVIMAVDRQINEFINRAGSKEKLEEWLNKPLHQIKSEQRTIMRNQSLTQEMQANITADVKVTPAQVRNYYKRISEDSLPIVQSQYEFQQIRIDPKIDVEEVEKVKSRLREFQRQVADGDDFATLAVLYSEDPGSAARGGELGFMTRAELVQEYAKVAFNLQGEGKVSKIVESEFGFHIIQLIARQGDRVNTRHILLKPKVRPDDFKNAQMRIDSIAGLIDEEKISFDEAALHFSMDKDTRMNGGLMVNPYSQSTKFDIQEIPPTITRQIEKMEVGEVSKSFLMKDERLGKDYLVLVKLKSKTEPHRANITDDYELIKNILENNKSQDLFFDWIKKKQKETYITISPKWANCKFEFDGWKK